MGTSLALLVVAGFALALALSDIYIEESDLIVSEFVIAPGDSGQELLLESGAAHRSQWENQAAWNEAHHFLRLAKALDPLNPKLHADLGSLFELRVPETGELDAGALKALDQALESYRFAVTLRPAWPYGWTDIAMVKLRQKHFDAEFVLAIERAETLGPWEPGVQFRIAEGALETLEDLPASVQETVRATVARGLELGLPPFVALAEQYGYARLEEKSR